MMAFIGLGAMLLLGIALLMFIYGFVTDREQNVRLDRLEKELFALAEQVGRLDAKKRSA